MRKFVFLLALFFFSLKSISQESLKKTIPNSVVGDTIKIANEELEYEVTIIDAGFAVWLASRAQPRNFYSESFLENKNQFYVSEWNRRVLEPQRFDPTLYELKINYDPSIHYGYEVNYLIYNSMIYFQNTYRQRQIILPSTRQRICHPWCRHD